MADLAALDRGDVLIDGEKIIAVGQDLSLPRHFRVVEGHGRVLMPGFVDCHTHACWAGDRLDEWSQRLAGASYLDILKAGGGIMSTVRAVRACTEEGLIASLRRRLEVMLRLGSTTVEVKSGYGLAQDCELKMLRAIVRAAMPGSFPGRKRPGPPVDAAAPLPTVVPTALLGTPWSRTIRSSSSTRSARRSRPCIPAIPTSPSMPSARAGRGPSRTP
jgi:imidazolonepropionase